MKRGVAIAGVAVAALLAAPAAAGINLRAPQVFLDPAPLQAFLDAHDQGIQAPSDQLDVPTWSEKLVPGSEPSVILHQTNGSTVGIYATDTPNPTLVPMFDSQSKPGAFAVLDPGQSHVRFYLFDANYVFLRVQDCPDIRSDHYQFYVQGTCGTWFGEDARNAPPAPQALAYRSNVAVDYGWWLCFEGCAYRAVAPAPSTFASVILELDYRIGDDAKARSWGAVKALYR